MLCKHKNLTYKLFDELVETGVIRRVFHATNQTSAGTFIHKKNWNVRLVVNHCVTNAHIKRPTWPMISINRVKGKIKFEWRYFFSLDLTSGYNP